MLTQGVMNPIGIPTHSGIDRGRVGSSTSHPIDGDGHHGVVDNVGTARIGIASILATLDGSGAELVGSGGVGIRLDAVVLGKGIDVDRSQ